MGIRPPAPVPWYLAAPVGVSDPDAPQSAVLADEAAAYLADDGELAG